MREDFHRLAYIGQDGPTDFIDFGTPIFDSEELSDTVYRTLLAMLKESFGGERGSVRIEDFGRLFTRGVYLPCEQRVALVGQIDILNDPLPQFCAMAQAYDNGDVSFFTATRINKLPVGVAALRPGWAYRVAAIFEEQNALEAIPHYVTIGRDGAVHHCINRHRFGIRATGHSWFVAKSCLALAAHTDARFLWQVRTSEHLIGNRSTPLTLGVGAETVKSLFYAREAPLTESGRRRPILHWVRSHQRRIKEGIDIDVSKHLRGITRFEMDGMGFEITSPVKREQTKAA